MKKTNLYYAPAIIWTIIILLLTLLPGHDFPQTSLFNIPQFDKVVHAGLFFLFVVAWNFGEYKIRPHQLNKSARLFCIVAILLGITIEFLQLWWKAIHRDFEWLDMLADSIGAILGAWASLRYLPRMIKRFSR